MEMIKENIEKLIEERVKEELDTFDTEELYNDMLDECYEDVEVCGMTFSSRRILEELDPIAYRCGMNDYIDSLELTEIDGEYYNSDDVGRIRNEIEEELEGQEEV